MANQFVALTSNVRTERFNGGLNGLLWRAGGMAIFADCRKGVPHTFGCVYADLQNGSPFNAGGAGGHSME